LVYANLKRLKFVHDNAVLSGKDELYLDALNKIARLYADQAISTEINYQRAQYYYDKGRNHTVGAGGVEATYWKKAFDICEEAVTKFPDSFGAKQCRALMASIQQKNLNFQTERINLPNQAALMNISYQNISKVYGRIIKVTDKEKKKIDGTDWDKKGKEIMKLDPLKGFSIDLPKVDDYRLHTTE